MKDKRVLVTLLAVVIVFCIGIIAIDKYSEKRAKEIVENIQKISRMDTSADKVGYTSPINFKELKKINEDIYAWVVISGTNVDLPVVLNKDNNAYYMNRDITHSYSAAGSLFSENYNGTDLNDKVVIIYGHNMKDGSMLGEMKNYSSDEYFKSHNRMIIYLPEREKHYELVASVPFDDRHIMLSYDFSKKSEFKSLVYELMNVRNMNARYAKNARIDAKDKLVILSTCYFGRRDMRYLIVWKEIQNEKNN